jgi:hypothetical protein
MCRQLPKLRHPAAATWRKSREGAAPARSKRVMETMLQMDKLDVARLQQAWQG